METLLMEKVSSATLKKDFGRVMDEVQHSPITITRHGRDIATIFSHRKIEEAAKQLLGEYPLELVESGELNIFEALIFQNKILEGVAEAEKQVKNGKYHEATDEYFENIKKRALANNPS